MNTYKFAEERVNPRGVLQQFFEELAQKDSSFVVLSPDISRSSLAQFIEKYPERHLNMGIAEQSTVDFAAGLALEGKKPFVYGMAPFLSMRSCEQVRTNACYQRANVKIVGYSSGLTGNGGSTHFSLEDYGIMRLFPNMKVILPGDPNQVRKALIAAYEYNGPVYIRLGGSFNESLVYKEDYDFEIGKGIEVKSGDRATIIATGVMLAYALDAADKLAQEGIDVSVVDMHTIKPIDRELVLKKAAETGRIITVEDHNVFGGLGTAVAEVLAEENANCVLRRLGVPDEFPGFGVFDDQLKKYKFDAESIAETVKSLL